ncbi:MAG: phosphoesterase [Myxococcota bacterium]
MTKTIVRLGLSLALATAAAGGAAASTVVVEWNEAALEAIRTTHPGPPIVARALAVTHTCVYDAWAAYDHKAIGTRLGASLRRPVAERNDANREEAISYAAHRALVDLFPSEQALFDGLLSDLGYDPANASLDPSTPAGIGHRACDAVLAFRHQDGSNQLGDLAPGAYSDYTGYAPINTPDQVNDIGRWQPLRVSDGHGGFVVQKFITPHWKNVVPFALKRYDTFRIKRPAVPGTAAFEEQAREVVAYSAVLNDQQKVVAEYWADGPTSELPPGHWTLFAAAVSERDGHDLEQDVKMFMLVGNAQLDASIATWGYKVDYDYVRPVTAIHELFAGQEIEAWAGPYLGTSMIPAEDWQPYQAATVVTPPFAEYVSGHSTFSAAGAQVLKRFTGSDVFKFSVTIGAGTSRVEPGSVPANDLTLSWATFTEAADEAGASRRFGGIHFIDGDIEGRALGRKIGNAVFDRGNRLFEGRN